MTVTLDHARAIAAGFAFERSEAELARVPSLYRELVIKVASLMIAGQIAALRTLVERRGALELVPLELLDLVKSHLRREFLAREEIRRRQGIPADLFEEAAPQS